MKFVFLIISFPGFIKFGFSQNPGNNTRLKGDLTCSYRVKYSEIQRQKFYPFNSADSIKLVSFRYQKHNSPIKEGSILLDSLIEVETLTNDDINSLTDILYNNFYKKRPNYGYLTQCFFPRNAIIFLDKAGTLTEYILLCFHCDRHEQSSENVQYGDDCEEKVEKLRTFFILKGIKFGTDTSVLRYPGENFRE